jgi:hypothetical protein
MIIEALVRAYYYVTVAGFAIVIPLYVHSKTNSVTVFNITYTFIIYVGVAWYPLLDKLFR